MTNNDHQYSTDEIHEMLRLLNLKGASDELTRQLSDVRCSTLCFEQRVGRLLEPDILRRKKNRIQKKLKKANINDEMITVENTIFEKDRGISEAHFKELLRCNWLSAPEHAWLAFTGRSGTGKTWLAKLLVRASIEHEYNGLFLRTQDLIDDIYIAIEQKRSEELRNSLDRYDLLVLDDFHLIDADSQVRLALLDIIDHRWNKKALIFTSQYPVSEWYDQIGGTVAQKDAFMDRIINGTCVIELKGRSYRERRQLRLFQPLANS